MSKGGGGESWKASTEGVTRAARTSNQKSIKIPTPEQGEEEEEENEEGEEERGESEKKRRSRR